MKKTLIALAAVAATGAAFAQSVTLSGEFAYGYQSKTTSGVVTKGFGVDTAAVNIAATEDLGGGLKMSASMALGGITRGDTPTGEDFKMVLSGGFGSVLLGQIEIGSGIRGLAQAGAPVNNMEGEVLDPATAGTDIVKYTAPSMSGFTFSGSLTEAKGLATGLDAATKGTSAYTIGVDYAAGPIKAKLDYSDWNSASTTSDHRYRIAGQYDFGVAKLGAGYDNTALVGGGSKKFTMVGVSAPVGAFNLGAAWVKKDTTAVAGSQTGYTIGASYSLSKRTSVTANYARWEQSEVAGVASDKKTTILLVHAF